VEDLDEVVSSVHSWFLLHDCPELEEDERDKSRLYVDAKAAEDKRLIPDAAIKKAIQLGATESRQDVREGIEKAMKILISRQTFIFSGLRWYSSGITTI
jgi:hypothetical protein